MEKGSGQEEKLLFEIEEALKRLNYDALRKVCAFIANMEPSSLNATQEEEDK